jgi:hypothetical protein
MSLWLVDSGVGAEARRHGGAEARMDQELPDRPILMTVADGTLAGRMGITITSASASRVVAATPRPVTATGPLGE